MMRLRHLVAATELMTWSLFLLVRCACLLLFLIEKWGSPRSARNRRRTRLLAACCLYLQAIRDFAALLFSAFDFIPECVL